MGTVGTLEPDHLRVRAAVVVDVFGEGESRRKPAHGAHHGAGHGPHRPRLAE
ncbi:hypothetical protein [uncultured Jatrophihabitans sp.]|uniref:hypothetical protein n=1 Tax=uncultured Jatrophihabitans sp. TaxID=1610747 RepID=UPI0035CA17EC